jgi:replicative DNA helicase
MLCHELTREGQLESVGDAGYVSSLLDGVPDRASIAHHIQTLRKLAQRRRVIAACEASAARALDDDPLDVIGDLTGTLSAIASGTDDPGADSASRATDEALTDWERQNSRTTELIGIPTGLPSLDRLTCGFRSGEYVIIGAWPGQGKSALACQIAAANCMAGNTVHFFSLEMSKPEILKRMWASRSGVPFWRIHTARCDVEAATSQVRAAAVEVARWPLLIAADSWPVERIVARAKARIRRFKTALVIVDFLQNVPHNERDPRLGINHVSAGLRELAKSIQVPVIAFSQLRRTEHRTRPTMFDLRESGQLEQDAHFVGLLHRPMNENNQLSGEDLLIVDKHRHGPLGDILLRFNSQRMEFEERPACS